MNDPVDLAGIRFPNRVGLAAGLDKNARCIDGLGAMGFGFVEVGTVTPLAQGGNPKPRMFRLPKARALINRLGFNNEGLAAFVANVQLSRLHRERTGAGNASGTPMRLGLNIGKNAATPIERATDDYLTCLDGVYPYADYVTVYLQPQHQESAQPAKRRRAGRLAGRDLGAARTVGTAAGPTHSDFFEDRPGPGRRANWRHRANPVALRQRQHRPGQ